MEYVKDRTENFDDYYPCIKKEEEDCNLSHVYQWMVLFLFMHNTVTKSNIKFSKINELLGGENP